MPGDRTTKQPAVGICFNPVCKERSEDQWFEFAVNNDKFCCPKCKSDRPPFVTLKTLTHYLRQCPDGPIQGSGGLRYEIACDPKRAYLATPTNNEAATGVLEIVNCPGCLESSKE